MSPSVTTPSDQPFDSSVDRARVLTLATGAFTIFFAVWVMFAIVGLKLRKEFHLDEGEFAMLTALPILIGSVLRVPVGIWTDMVGGRRMMTALLVITAVPTYFVSKAHSYEQLLILGALLGLAGTSFAIGIAWVSAWYPRERQGFALGVFGAGNVGASITKLCAPWLLGLVGAGGLLGGLIPGGWRFVPVVYTIALLLTAAIVWFASPKHDHKPGAGRSVISLLAPLKEVQVWRFGYYYVIVFGAYVGLSLWLPKYYVDVYDLHIGKAGLLTALFIFPASLLRPFGGWLSDRYGARKVTFAVFGAMIALCIVLTQPMALTPFTMLVFAIGISMGIGKASVYKYVPEYYPVDVGAVGGLVGAIGGLGGFFLPLLFAKAHAMTHSAQSTWTVMLVCTLIGLAWLTIAVIRITSSKPDTGAI